MGDSQFVSNQKAEILVISLGHRAAVKGNVCRSLGGASVPVCGIEIQSTACVVESNDVYDDGFGTAPLIDDGTSTVIRNNRGYNPVGISAITVGASPFTYTAGASPETVYVSGGTITSITKGGNNFGLTSGAFNLEPYESIIVTYTVAPTMYKDVH